MTAEIRSLKCYMGHEGRAYNAVLYLDGKKAATAIDQGDGGAPYLQFCDQKAAAAWEAWLAEQPGDPKDPMRWETALRALVDAAELRTKLRRACRTKTLYVTPRFPVGAYSEVKVAYKPVFREVLVEKNGEPLLVINEDIERAIRVLMGVETL